METHSNSDAHHAAIQKADQEAWKKFDTDGTEVTRLSQTDIELMTEAAAPIWFKYANRRHTTTAMIFASPVTKVMASFFLKLNRPRSFCGYSAPKRTRSNG